MRRSRLPTSAKVSLACCSCALSGRASSVEALPHDTLSLCGDVQSSLQSPWTVAPSSLETALTRSPWWS